MVQKGKVEETVLESLPQLAIQIINTWMLGQLQSIPPLTSFSISLSVLSLANTMWYYAYWNLFRCMSIRDVPSTLALYNYKLSDVADGPLSFAKALREVAEIELESVTISGTVLNKNAPDEPQLPTRESKLSADHQAAVISISQILKLQDENRKLVAENSKLTWKNKQLSALPERATDPDGARNAT
jgi:hypothetical protein